MFHIPGFHENFLSFFYCSYTRTCKAIVEEVLEELRRKQADLIHHMVGKDDHVSAISELLDLESTELKFLTIHGMGGIGKTTIAKVIFSLFRDQFQGCSFLANVGESSQQPHGLKHLKQQLLRDTIGINKEEQLLADIAKIDDGEVMRRRFLGRKVLIVLDDVGQADQVERLVGKYTTWFGLGSRVIITTRSMVAPLRLRYKTRVYEMRAMRYDEAITLFSRHAFGMDYPPDDYHSLSHEIVRRVGGFPLTLEAMGSFLYRKNEYIWKSTTSKLKLMPRSQSDDVLKICYDALTYEEKQIFLDIACFFVGEEKTNPDYMWNACGYFPEQGIKSLETMSLVRILDGKRFSMHDVLRCLGRRIGRDHGQCASRVWLTEDEQGTLKDAKVKKIKNATNVIFPLSACFILTLGIFLIICAHLLAGNGKC